MCNIIATVPPELICWGIAVHIYFCHTYVSSYSLSIMGKVNYLPAHIFHKMILLEFVHISIPCLCL